MLKKSLRVVSLIIAIISLLFSAACSGNSELKSELARNQKLWADQKITHYSYQLHISCFCPQSITEPVNIEVKDGSPVARTYVSRGETATDEFITGADTIEEIFKILKDALNGGADETTVEYDTKYGYPSRIYLDRIKNAIDDELAYEVSQFTVLP